MAKKKEYGYMTLQAFEEASEKVKEVAVETKLIHSDFFSKASGNQVYLKPENMQRTGAYKIRGAYYRICRLSKEEREKPLEGSPAVTMEINTPGYIQTHGYFYI